MSYPWREGQKKMESERKSDVLVYKKLDVLGYYKLLNLTPHASAAEIRKSYYALALVYHPDKNSSPEAELTFKAIVQAYDVLRDPEKRCQYDLLTWGSCINSGAFGANVPSENLEINVPAFLFGSLLGTIFVCGASAGIIVFPIWGWILAPTLLLVVAPTLHVNRFTKLAALCCGIAVAPITFAIVGVSMSLGVISGVAGVITGSVHSKSKPHLIEDIEDGWVSVGEE